MTDQEAPTSLSSGSQSDASGEDDFPRVRDHSYLPGTSHPLHTEHRGSLESDLSDTSRRGQFGGSVSFRGSGVTELAVLELPDVILFPGSTFPVRFSRNSAWMEYLGRKIQASRITPGQAEPVRLGILTALPERRSRVDEEYRLWARQSFGPVRPRRLSEQLIRELADSSSDTTDATQMNENQRETDDRAQEDVERHLRAMGRTQRMPYFEADSSIEDDTRMDVQEQQQPREARREESPGAFSIPRHGATRDRYGYIDRIGTIVTVTYTHGDEADNVNLGSFSSAWRSIQESGQLVLQCLATGRFRITGYAGSDETHDLYRAGVMFDPMSTVRTFYVEEFDDKPLPLPPLNRLFSSLPPRLSGGDTVCPQYNQMMHSLSMVSSIPEYVFVKHWPWRLVSLIKESMARSQTFAPFLDALPDDDRFAEDEVGSHEDPVRLSFWMASNLPFTQQEKIRLLEMHSTDERLRFIHDMVLREDRSAPSICCQVCSIPLARSIAMFTFCGAEGTTGAYTNMHGIIHQTISVRSLDEYAVMFSGGAQTQDSWFPGYSWTCMSCSICRNHLGWKFQRVPGSPRQSQRKNRPVYFYLLSGGAVKVIVPSEGRRRTRRRI